MVVIAGISGSVILWNHNKSGVPIMGSQAVKEASAEKGSISKTIVGTGNLEADTPVNVTVPSGVVIDEVKVESGYHVSAGDVLATVDNASVLSAMMSRRKLKIWMELSMRQKMRQRPENLQPVWTAE